uniref:Putative ovule protein n=1 Tax=Solanum chacoense TaxID=4108 RepID=A0A0V0GTD5_SOLCH
MGESRIYFAVGFKSYDITKITSRSDTWFEWVERSRKLMGRLTFNRKTMEWIVFALREASTDNGTHTRRWKMNEQFADFFCSRKHNRLADSLV